MANKFFTSDLHFLHKNIVKYCNRPWTAEDQTDELIARWNSRVGEYDDVYHLGDFAFASRKQYAQVIEIIKRLNGNIHFIRGNHCDSELWGMIEQSRLPHVVWIKDYAKIRVQGQKVILSHFPFATWDSAHHGSWHLFGHCVDMKTELLTVDGWKSFGDFSVGDVVPTYNQFTGMIENQQIIEVFNPTYSGEVYTLQGKSANGRFTKDHRIVGLYAHSDKYTECTPAKPVKSKLKLIHSGRFASNTGLKLTDDQFSIFMEAYSLSDGSKNGNGVIITTAKKCEADLIQELAVTHGWSCTSQERRGHGFSTKPSWSLSVFQRESAICSAIKSMSVEVVQNEPFWCIKTSNGNFFIRRNGKVHLTGNCHGSFEGFGKSMDVGIDNHPDFQVFSYDEVKTYMDKQQFVAQDHHNAY